MRNNQTNPRERALLVAVSQGGRVRAHLDYQIEEIRSLARTAGADVQKVCEQDVKTFHPATLVGSGKVEEIGGFLEDGGFDLVLFNRDLSPVQQRNLEKRLNRRIVDRTELILDIFAQHALTRDGKIQVELAQLRYLRPRLTGRGIDLSRLGGGIGTRGPGETKLEIDRRRIGQRIARLNREWEKTRNARREQRKSRLRHNLPSAVLVGYTNAGKSTLLNRLASAKVVAKDQLFSTLDTTTRRLRLRDGSSILVSDTVGFISGLPEPLLAAFRATLEIVEEADLLIHVADASSPYLEDQFHAVHGVLQQLGCGEKPVLTVFNKMDRADGDLPELRDLERSASPGVRCSATRDENVEPIKDKIREMLSRIKVPVPPEEPPEDEFQPWMDL